MNNQDLDDVLRQLDPERCLQLFSNMDEKQRKLLSARALSWLTVSRGCNIRDVEFEGHKKFDFAYASKRVLRLRDQEAEAKQLATLLPPEAVRTMAESPACIATFATCTFTEIKKHNAFPNSEFCYRLLFDRKPKWTDQFSKFVLEKHGGTYFDCIRQLERIGIASPAHDSTYLGAMALSLGSTDALENTRSRLLADPELFDTEMWRMLEDDTAVRTLLSQPNTFWGGQGNWYGKEAANWTSALVSLADEGRIEKLRVLRTNLSTLLRLSLESSEGPTINTQWFMHMHRDLKPDEDQHVTLAEDYCSLLRSRSQNSVAWAIDQLQSQINNPQFPVENACFALANVFLTKGKENSQKALEYLKALAQDKASARTSVALCATEAFSHSSPDIHKQAIALIEKYGDKNNQELIDRVSQQMEYVTIVNRERLVKWLPNDGAALQENAAVPKISTVSSKTNDGATNVVAFKTAASSTTTQAEAGGQQGQSDLNDELESLDTRAQSLPEHWLKIACIQSGFNAIEGKEIDLESVDFDGNEIPRLDPDKLLQPIQDLDELVFLLARCTNEQKLSRDMNDLELALDGISRLANDRPADFDQRTAAIRAQNSAGYDVVSALTDAWISKRSQTTRMAANRFEDKKVVDRLLTSRFVAVAERISTNVAMPVLAMPTHKGGWIDPRVLVQRVIDGAHLIPNIPSNPQQDKSVLEQLAQAMAPIHQLDVSWAMKQLEQLLGKKDDSQSGNILEQSLAILRLAPDHREEALRKLDGSNVSKNEFIDALRYALGAQGVKIGTTAALWVVAARSRAPFIDDDAVEQSFPGLGPDCGRAAHYSLSLAQHRLPTPGGYHSSGSAFQLLNREPQAVSQSKQLIPSAVLHFHQKNTFVNHCYYQAWASTIWPLCMEPFFATGAEHVADNCSTSGSSVYNVFLEPLYDPDIPAKSMAMLLIVLGLTAKAQEESGAAIEALIQCIDDGRINGRKLGEALQPLFAARPSRVDGTPLIYLQRWAKTLRTVAQSSQYHARVVALGIEHCLQGNAEDAPKDLHALLEVLLELHTQEQQSLLLPTARDFLSGLKTSGKTQKLSKQLLGLKPGAMSNQNQQTAFLHALTRRIERVERWQELAQRSESELASATF